MTDPRDESLAGADDQHTGHDEHVHGDTPFGNPNGVAVKTPTIKYLSLDEVLTSAKRTRTIAHICMRADLQAEYDDLVAELATLVDHEGRLLATAEEALGEEGGAARAQEIDQRMRQLRLEMNQAMRQVEFEGMPEDKWRPWYNTNFPHQRVKTARSSGQEPDISDFNNKLIAETAVSPTFTEQDVAKLRTVLTTPQMSLLANKAWAACTTGGVDVPK
jgi:hypothetical protein